MIILNILLLIFANAVSNNKTKSVFYSRITIISLIIAGIINYNNLYVTSIAKGISLYNGLLNVTSLTQSFNLFIIIITSVILIYNSFSLRSEKRLNLSENNILKYHTSKTEYHTKMNEIYNDTKTELLNISEYSLIISFILTGACFLMSSGDFITIFISIELQSYGLYILSTLNKDSEQATWGGLTYFLLGGLSSCFILLGSSLIYINTGNTSLDGFYIISSLTEISSNIDILQNNINDSILGVSNQANLSFNSLILYDNYYINIALIILIVGFLFKVSASPFHFWSPDVYDAIPTTVTTYVAIIAKLSIFVLLLELVYYIDGNMQGNLLVSDLSNNNLLNLSWKDLILVSSLLSLLTGSILGLTQYRIKRLYAYSTISHVGFILLALCINRAESIQAYIFYILSYTISNLNAFMILVAIGYTMYFYTYNTENTKTEILNLIKSIKTKSEQENEGKLDKLVQQDYVKQDLSFKLSYDLTFNHIENSNLKQNGVSLIKDVKYSPIQLLSQLKGYFYINTYLALSLAITLFSFIGIPPLIGFFAKQMVLSAALDNGYIFITLVGIITSVIAAAYYLNIIKLIFFFKSDYVINPGFLKSINLLKEKYTLFANDNVNTSDLALSQNTYILNKIRLSNPLCLVISILTLFLLLFIFVPNESLSLTRIITLLLFI